MKRIIFLGDSITDAGHNLCVDEYGLGDGYVSRIAGRLRQEESGDFRVMNRGHDGFTLRGIFHFLERDCIRNRPDVVSILIGCNDVGLMMNTGRTLEERQFSADYERLLREIEEETEARIICMAPFIFPYPQEYESWIPHIRYIEDIVRETAKRSGAAFIPLHDRLNGEAKKLGYAAVTTDGIHLAPQGAEIVAEEWCRAWKFGGR